MTASVLFVAGTATGVGKTWVAARLVRLLVRRGVAVAAVKPVQSHAPGETPDSVVLGQAAGCDPDRVCPPERTYAVAMAPPMAAEVLGLSPPSLVDLVAGVSVPARGVAVIEGVGGVRSPVSHDADNVDLAAALRPDVVVVVAPAGLGAINDVRLATAALAGLPTTVFLNRFDPRDDLHRRNLDWLARRDRVAVTASLHELAARYRAPVSKEVG